MRRCWLLALMLLVLKVSSPAWGGDSLAVIVHRERTDTVTVDELSTIFLRQRRFWGDGSPIVPLNRELGSTARDLFSKRVFGKEGAHLAEYWNQQYFQGVFPPTTLSSAAAVKRYVAAERNAIGYVGESEVDGSVRVLLWIK